MEKVPKIEPQRFMQFYRVLVETLAKHQLEEEDWTTKEGMEREVKRAFIVDKQDVEGFARFFANYEEENTRTPMSKRPLICFFGGWYRLAMISKRALVLWVNGSEEKPVRAGRKTVEDLSREFPEIHLELDCLH